MACRGRGAIGVRDEKLRGSFSGRLTPGQGDAIAAFVECGGLIARAAAKLGLRPSTVKRHLADARARFGLSTEQLIYKGREGG